MGFIRKGIAFTFVLMLCAFGYVGLSLAMRSPARAGTPPRVTNVLQPRPDGSLYSVSLELEKFERRLMEEEKRSEKLQTDLAAVQQSKEELTDQVTELQDEVKRLRRQVVESQKPATRPVAPEGNSPSIVPPAGANGPGGEVLPASPPR